jgi:hypothetical protein
MTMMTMRYLREPRGLHKQWVYQRSIPSKLQAYDRGRNGKSRKKIEIGLGRSRAEAIANYQSVHEQQEERFSRLKQYFLNGTQPSYRIDQLQLSLCVTFSGHAGFQRTIRSFFALRCFCNSIRKVCNPSAFSGSGVGLATIHTSRPIPSAIHSSIVVTVVSLGSTRC